MMAPVQNEPRSVVILDKELEWSEVKKIAKFFNRKSMRDLQYLVEVSELYDRRTFRVRVTKLVFK